MKYIWQILTLLLAAALVLLLILDIAKVSTQPQEVVSSEKDAMNIIMNRTSVRSYSDKIIPDDVMQSILRAGMAAPSGKNAQPWELIEVRDRETLDALSEAQPFANRTLKDATAAIVVCGYSDPENGGSIYWDVDCAAVSQNILLAVEYFGVGAVWTTTHPHAEPVKKVREILNLPNNITPLNVISMGYPDSPKAVKDKWNPKKVHTNEW